MLNKKKKKKKKKDKDKERKRKHELRNARKDWCLDCATIQWGDVAQKNRRLRSACLLSDYYSAKLDVFQHLDFLFSLCPKVFTVVHVGGRELNDSCLYRQNFEILEMSLWPRIAGKYLDQLRRPLWIFVNVTAQTAIRCSISSLMYCIQIILGGAIFVGDFFLKETVLI